MDTPKIMHNHNHCNGDLTEMEYQNSEIKRSPSVVAHIVGLEEIPGNSNPTFEKNGALYLSKSEGQKWFNNFSRDDEKLPIL